MGKPFAKVHACSVGKFDEGDKFPQWVRANGGEFHREVDERTTHLIATKDAYKRDVDAVQKARELGTVKIVSYDWLEDSLLSKSRRPKPEEPYLLENLVGTGPKRAVPSRQTPAKTAVPKVAKKRIKDPFVTKKPASGSRAAAAPKIRIYEDPDTGERWYATLIRASQPPRPREKYLMAIFETIAEPHHYPTYIKYSRVGVSSVEQLAPPKSDLTLATTTFKKFFKLQTGKEWEDRADGEFPGPKTDPDGNLLPAHEGWYTFDDNTSIFTKFIRETPQQSASSERASMSAAIEEASNDGTIDDEAQYDSGNDADLESCNDGQPVFDFEDEDDTFEMIKCRMATWNDEQLLSYLEDDEMEGIECPNTTSNDLALMEETNLQHDSLVADFVSVESGSKRRRTA